jgi:lysozyme
MTRQINEAGKNLIKQFEGLRLKPYKCPAGVWTVGYGHTESDGTIERWAESGRVMTTHEAEVILDHDLANFEEWVEKLAPGVSDNQFAALVSFAFNLGTAALARSNLLKHVQAGEWQAAGDQFLKWIYGGGKVLPGLARRRDAERALFLSGSKL